MITAKFDVNELRIATPCSVGWESMTGDDRTRHCQACSLTVHNISAMTVDEVDRLITSSNGRTCVKMRRRSDGTVLTRDCPVGLRGYRMRMSRIAGAAFGTILGIFSISFGQKEDSTPVVIGTTLTVTSPVTIGATLIEGHVVDTAGAVVPNVQVLLYLADAKDPAKAVSDEQGRYVFPNLTAGKYRIKVPAVSGFREHIFENVQVTQGRITELTLVLNNSTDIILIGVVGNESPIDLTTTGPSPRVTTREMIDRLPGGRPF